MLHRAHTVLTTAYILGGLIIMASTPWTDLRGALLTQDTGPLTIETLRGSADTTTTQLYNGGATLRTSAPTAQELSDEALAQMRSAIAAKQLMFGILLFTLGGFVHAYERLRSERPVRITVKKKKPILLYWLEMKI